MGEMKVLNVRGDHKMIWDPTKPDEVDAAAKTFKKLTKKGYVAYEVGAGGKPKKGSIVKEFDKHLEKLILAPQIAGG